MISKELEDTKELMLKGYFNEALQEVERLEKIEGLTSTERILSKLLKSSIMIKLGRYQESLELADVCLQENLAIGNFEIVVDAIIVKTEALWRLGKFDESLKAIERGESVLTKLGHDDPADVISRKAFFFRHKGTVNYFQGNSQRALECYLRSLNLNEEIKNKQEIAACLNNIGNIYQQKGELDKALEYQHRCLILNEEIGNEQDIAASLNNIGIVHYFQGNLEEALDYLQRSLALKEETGNIQDIASTVFNLANVYGDKGDLDRSLELYKIGLSKFKEINHAQYIGYCLNNIGQTYRLKADLDRAMEYSQMSLKYFEEIGNDVDISSALLPLVIVAVEENSISLALQYLSNLRQVNEGRKNITINQRYRFAEAMILKKSTRMKQKVKAQELFQEIVKEDITEWSLTASATIHLCELLLDEFKAYKQLEVFYEVENLVQRLYSLAQEQRSFSSVVEALILKAKFSMVVGQLVDAMSFLDQAVMTAEEKGLAMLKNKVVNEKNYLEDCYEGWVKLIQNNVPFSTRLDRIQLSEYLQEVQKSVSFL